MSISTARGDRHLLVACLLLLASGLIAIVWLQIASRPQERSAVANNSITVLLPPPNLLRPISPQEALRDNASRSFVIRPDSPAAPFRFAGDAVSRIRAIECLTQAVYYEAAADGPQGERAVAQVILNRVRHPGFPSSVCGVIYEGANAPGCQFTFTCDGSLGKTPAPSLWGQARKIAVEELTGKVFAPVGHATHYHADYVLPYWADSLDKSVQIGHQIFYRLKGLFGNSGAFTQSYARSEPPLPRPLPNPTDATEELAAGAGALDPGAVATVDVPKVPTHPQLLADVSAGTLIGDSAIPEAAGTSPDPRQQSVRRPTHGDCERATSDVRLRPLAANDLHSDGKSSCVD